MSDPLHQFTIKPIVALDICGVDISFSNSSFYMTLALVCATVFFICGIFRASIIPNRYQSIVEIIYTFVFDIFNENVGEKGKKYFAFVFCLFIFILTGNILGMVPYSFTYTSHIIVTFGLAMIVFLVSTAIGFARHGLNYFSLFFPSGAPIYMAPLIVPIEILSYLSRPVSLSIRLFANMMAGHTMLKVFAGFTVVLGLFGIGPLFINVLLTAFEILVAILQAYVFTILTCIYLHDAVHLH